MDGHADVTTTSRYLHYKHRGDAVRRISDAVSVAEPEEVERLTGTRWFTQQGPGDPGPYAVIQLRDDRDANGKMPTDGVFGFFILSRGRGHWRRDDGLIYDVSGFGGVSGIRETDEAEARRYEQMWLRPGEEPAP